MRAVLFVVFLNSVVYLQAVDVARCCNDCKDINGAITFTPFDDGIAGRYLAKWCTTVLPGATSWELETRYDDEPGNRCKDPTKAYSRMGHIHSRYKENVTFDGNCSYICLNTTVDLVFSSCYILNSRFYIRHMMRKITTKVINVENDYTKLTIFNNTPRVDVQNLQVHINDTRDVSIVWHTGVPFTYFRDPPLLWKKHNASLDVSQQDSSGLEEIELTSCSAPSQTEVKCFARLTPGTYQSHLQLHAPWVHGLFSDQGFVTFNFTVTSSAVPGVEQSDTRWQWAAGALGAAAALCAVACYACRRRDTRALQKRVLRHWTDHRNETSHTPAAVKQAKKHILLLYAREGPVAAKLCAALKHMLEENSNTKVYDLFSPEVLSLAASGPAAWVRGMLQRDDVAVLLLQTPAMAALYRHQLCDKDNTRELQEPLLGRRVLYRAPQYGDTLLQYAIALAAETLRTTTTTTTTDYHKYYIAYVTDLPTEVFPALVPFRRYAVPGGAALLARDLCDVTPAEHALLAVTHASTELAHLARDNPHYLMDELMLV